MYIFIITRLLKYLSTPQYSQAYSFLHIKKDFQPFITESCLEGLIGGNWRWVISSVFAVCKSRVIPANATLILAIADLFAVEDLTVSLTPVLFLTSVKYYKYIYFKCIMLSFATQSKRSLLYLSLLTLPPDPLVEAFTSDLPYHTHF